MFQLTCKITITGKKTWSFNRIVGCEIVLDSETLTDTCTITLPKKIKWMDEQGIPVKRGDKIRVELGYDYDLRTRFTGYIRSVGTKSPVEIVCEDSMWLLKQAPVEKRAYEQVAIGQLLKDILPAGIPYKVTGEQNIGNFRISAGNVAGVLDSLKANGIQCFFKLINEEPVLHCGVIFPPEKRKKPFFQSGRNIITNDTKTVNGDDVKIKIKAISMLPDNSRIEITVGDKEGEERTLTKYNVGKAELENWAKQELEKLKCDGLTGSFTTFGVPETDKGDNILVQVDGTPKGLYNVKKVNVTFNEKGYRQTIELNRKL